MDKLREAKKVLKRYSRIFSSLQKKFYDGDDDAALLQIRMLTEKDLLLKELGFMLNKDGKKPRLIPYKEPSKERMTELQSLTLAARSGDMQAIHEMVKRISEE